MDIQKKNANSLCFKWGTVTNTLLNGIVPAGTLVVEHDKSVGA